MDHQQNQQSSNEPAPLYFGDENADLNEMTDEVHNERLMTAISKFWEIQAQEMVHFKFVTHTLYLLYNLFRLMAIGSIGDRNRARF